MWIRVEAVIGRLPEAVTYRAWATTVILTVLAEWGLRPTKTPQQQAVQHDEPTPPFQQNETMPQEKIQSSHLDTLLILQSSLKHPKHRINLQIHHQIRTPSEDPIRTFPLARTINTPLCTLCMRHAERLGLESVPRSPAHHSLIREVRDGVDALPSDIGRGLVREREEQ